MKIVEQHKQLVHEACDRIMLAKNALEKGKIDNYTKLVEETQKLKELAENLHNEAIRELNEKFRQNNTY